MELIKEIRLVVCLKYERRVLEALFFVKKGNVKVKG